MLTLSPQDTYIVLGVVSYALCSYAYYLSHFFIEYAPARNKPLRARESRRAGGSGGNEWNNNNNIVGCRGDSSSIEDSQGHDNAQFSTQDQARLAGHY